MMVETHLELVKNNEQLVVNQKNLEASMKNVQKLAEMLQVENDSLKLSLEASDVNDAEKASQLAAELDLARKEAKYLRQQIEELKAQMRQQQYDN